jgi:acetyltransferase-like isoleucine patch superfamily enzyme
MMPIHEGAIVDATATIADSAIVGAPYRALQDGTRHNSSRKTSIEAGCWIGEQVYVGAGAVIGSGSILHGQVRVESDVTVGSNVLLMYRSFVDLEATIGDDCYIGGFVCERATVGRGSRVFGDLVHRQHNPLLPWDHADSEEPSPVLEDEVFVGWRATVIGDVTVAARSYVAAHAIVSKSVPSRHVAYGHNQIVPYEEWQGSLRESPFFVERQTVGPDASRPRSATPSVT